MKFHSKPVYEAKVKTFNGVVKLFFWNNKIPKESVH